MLSEVLFFLLYFRLSDLYFLNQFRFRSFHCSSLALLSLKNTMYYGKSILDPYHSLQTIHLQSNQLNTTSNGYGHEDFHLKCLTIIPIYFIVYIFYDLKHCHKRIDLLIHHTMCLLWVYVNINHVIGFISFNILAEGITFAYTINTMKNQFIYRLIFTFFVRFPIWIIASYHYYSSYNVYNTYNTVIYLFNYIIFFFMILMDCVWFSQNLKKLKQICKRECERECAEQNE
jgi:hypothetical protein